MPLRRFAGYFLVLAACATVAFSSPSADPSAPPVTADAGMLPLPASFVPGRFADEAVRASFARSHSRSQALLEGKDRAARSRSLSNNF